MKYRIQGAERDTGKEVSVTVDADTPERARDEANYRGIVVSKLEAEDGGVAEALRAAVRDGVADALRYELSKSRRALYTATIARGVILGLWVWSLIGTTIWAVLLLIATADSDPSAALISLFALLLAWLATVAYWPRA